MTGSPADTASSRGQREKPRLSLRTSRGETASAAPTWPILVVDDDSQVHAMTRVLLRDFAFQGRGFEVIESGSAAEARAILAERPDIPVVLLDVVMETEDAGLTLAHFIRHELGNRQMRIILRTGQPGQAPERDVMLAYDINDYRAKTELTAQKLFTAVVGALRSWTDIDTIDRLKTSLEARVEERTRELAEARAFAESLVELLPNPVWVTDRDGAYRLYNRAFRDFFAIDDDQWHGRNAAEIPGPALPGHHDVSDGALLGGQSLRAEFETQLADAQGRLRTVMVAKGALTAATGPATGLVGLLTDITERKVLEQELRRLATTDPLTGAANRRHFMQAAQHETDRAGRYGGALSVVMLDIDHFKHVNDSWGHAIGDEVLRRVVHAINLGLRDIDILGRLGGEEFAVLLPETALDQAVAVAERLRQAIAEIQVPVGDGVTTVTASMGVAERCRDDGNVDHLLGRADRALYTAKQAGRDRVLAA